jgi:hypothetical protein
VLLVDTDGRVAGLVGILGRSSWLASLV